MHSLFGSRKGEQIGCASLSGHYCIAKAPVIRQVLLLFGMRRRSTLPGRYQPSTLDVLRLNFCVRYGNRWIPQAITTANGELIWVSAYVVTHADNRIGRNDHFIGNLYGSPLVLGLKSSFRPISIIKLHTLLRFHR